MKNCFKNFVADIKKSIYGKDYKGDFGSRSFGQGLSYLAKLIFVESLVFLVFIIVLVIPFAQFALDRNNIASFVDSYVPKDVEITIKDGKVSTPNNEVVIVPAPDPKEGEEVKFENILVVDPKISSDELKNMEDYKTAVLVTSDKILSIEDGAVKISSLEEVPDYVINRDSVIGLYEKIRPYVYVMVPIFLILGAGVFFVFGTVYSLFGTLLFALVTWAISKIKKIELNYKQSYIITLFAITPPTIIAGVVSLIIQKNIGFIFWSIILVVFVWLNLNKQQS